MDWIIRSHYDRAAVLAASLFLIACSFFIWRSAAEFGSDFSANQAVAGARKAPLSKAEELEKPLRNPPASAVDRRSIRAICSRTTLYRDERFPRDAANDRDPSTCS
jgi:hypothetical protein